MNIKSLSFISTLLLLCLCINSQEPIQYVDPRIGSEGLGRTFPGPSMPFGMCKPGPDCTVLPNAGWAPMPQVVTGFSQTHVSGTGGGQKYGNILIMPYLEQPTEQRRVDETIKLGYYSTTFENGICTEITTGERCAQYRITASADSKPLSLYVDATHFLGKDSTPNLRERQQFVGAEVEVVSDHEVRGYSRIRGGWNNGDAYTVYFTLLTEHPFRYECDGQRAWLHFSERQMQVKIGISYVSTLQARKNISPNNFSEQLSELRLAWATQLSPIRIEGTEQQKRQFYTALYHTMLMPVDKSGENAKWTAIPYYDDYYAIWDTYRTSSPLLTLLDSQREIDIVNSLLNIYQHEGYMPDARSGDCNGRTQGGSNAEVVIADAFCKGLTGIDYGLALEAMLKDALVAPGGNEEKEGRGGLAEYNSLGYIPYGIDRAGNRTIEYAYCDWCIAQVAKGLGDTNTYKRFIRQANNWKNLWRPDYSFDGMQGFIMPRDRDGQWLDSVTWGKSQVFHPSIAYTPTTKVAPWYLPWWSTFFYEATSEEYSLSIPHDVLGLIDACGGAETFRQRLDRFFERSYYNVANEPSFLTPCLYHWIGRPDLTAERVVHIIDSCYTDRADGIPGNDDSGAMSSWLAFHMLGLYPNAGQPYYLLHTPMLSEYSLNSPEHPFKPAFRVITTNKKGKIVAPIDNDGKPLRVQYVLLNGRRLDRAWITHEELTSGGTLRFVLDKRQSQWGQVELPPDEQECSRFFKPILIDVDSQQQALDATLPAEPSVVAFTLNRQFRTWPFSIHWDGDTLVVSCRNAHFKAPRLIVERSNQFCWQMPVEGEQHVVDGTFLFISRKALAELKQQHFFVYDNITWRQQDQSDNLIHVKADIDGTEMWIRTDTTIPLIQQMKGNPLGIDWLMK